MADNGNGTYSNPLFFDEFSDPDMIRVGSDFYLTGTTNHSMPGLPILHSRDLVNWDFVTYAMDRLDLGPAFRLEDGKNVYGQGIWAPCFRFHDGTFYIFSNVNGQTMQLFRATNPAGPWTRTPMSRSFHDLSVLFDDDGRTYVVWGYRDIQIAQLTKDLLDVVPGSERQLIAPEKGMGEGLHLYKIHGKYILTSAWYLDEMRMPTARADKLNGPWEVNQNVSRGEDFGLAQGYRATLVSSHTDVAGQPTFRITVPDLSAVGRMAIHQGGIVDTPTGEWWGFSMMDANSVGRLTTLSPITWTDGWPYFGLKGNLGRSPRTWVKPNTGAEESPHAAYRRSDDFSGDRLQAVWQWNHVPVDGGWSLTERPGFLRLHALSAENLWTARNTLTERSIGPQSTVTVALDVTGLGPGDVAGFALFDRPFATLGIERKGEGWELTAFDEGTGKAERLPFGNAHVWLRADCDFLQNAAQFSYSPDGTTFHTIGLPIQMAFQLMTFQGVRYALFSYHQGSERNLTRGYADFDFFDVHEPHPNGMLKPIPYGKRIELRESESNREIEIGRNADGGLEVVDRGFGRVALRIGDSFLAVNEDGATALHRGVADESSSFQWIETFSGELTLLSLKTHRYLRVAGGAGLGLRADSPGPRPQRDDRARFNWQLARGVF